MFLKNIILSLGPILGVFVGIWAFLSLEYYVGPSNFCNFIGGMVGFLTSGIWCVSNFGLYDKE